MKTYSNYAGIEMVLVDANMKHVTFGAIIKDFRGNLDEITSFNPPHKASSSGRVNGYYPSVYGLQWIPVKEYYQHRSSLTIDEATR